MNTLSKTINILFLNLIIMLTLKSFTLAKSYTPPKRNEAPQQAEFTGTRGSCPDYRETILPLFPKAENLDTILRQPTFLIQVREPLKNPIYFSIIADEQIAPLYQAKIESADLGLLAFKVPANIELKLNKTYRLNFVIVCNDKRPSHNWLLTALITRRSPSVISKPHDSVNILEVAKTLSKEGLWFEALEMIYIKGLVDDSNFNSLLEVFRE